MTDLVSRKRHSPLKSEPGKSAFDAFAAADGPLGRIFRDPALRLTAAKGSRRYREQDKYAAVFDQAYFAHALNVATTAAIVFEAVDVLNGGSPSEEEVRIVLGAGALHDANKLPFAEGSRLSEAIRRPEVEGLLAGYLAPDGIHDARNLILSVEDRTSRDSSAYPLRILSGRRASRAQLALTLADRLVGSFADPTNPAEYAAIVQAFQREHADFPAIHVRSFTRVPQVALAREAREAFLTWIRRAGVLVHETEAYVSWIGPAPEEADLRQMDSALWLKIRPDPADAFRKAGTKNNSIRTSWATSISADPNTVDQWIETLGGQLVVWEGDWGVRNFRALTQEFPGLFRLETKKRERVKREGVKLQLPEADSARGAAAGATRQQGKLVIACCIEQFLQKGPKELPNTSAAPFDLVNVKGVMAATVAGILWARERRALPGAYEDTVARISGLIRADTGTPANPVAGFALAVLEGRRAPALAPPSGQACVYCGESATEDLEEAKAFGIKPTGWTPRKKGVQKESHRGKVCELCFAENQRRDTLLRTLRGTDARSGFLTVHIHAADLACDLDWYALIDPLLEPARIHQGKVVLVGKRKKDGQLDAAASQVVPLRGHFSVPVPKPEKSANTSETLAYLYRLRDFLSFVQATGFKINVSPLALSPAQQRAQFVWTNAPPWMEELRLAEVHVDEVADSANRSGALSVVEALLRAGFETGGSQGHRTFVSRLAREPLAIYDFPKARPGQGTRTFIDVLEEWYMKDKERAGIAAIAHAYIKFNARGEWSNNTWTWATRHFLDLRDRYRLQPDSRVLLVGDLHAAAKRKNEYAQIPDVEAFVDAMEDYLSAFRGGSAPIGTDQRVLINAVAYAAKRDYRLVYPKEDSP